MTGWDWYGSKLQESYMSSDVLYNLDVDQVISLFNLAHAFLGLDIYLWTLAPQAALQNPLHSRHTLDHVLLLNP